MKIKKTISIMLAMIMLTSTISVLAEENVASTETEAIDTTNIPDDEREIIVINGQEFDVTGWSAQQKDNLRSQNNSSFDAKTNNPELNKKLQIDYDINDLFGNGWSSEAAKEREYQENTDEQGGEKLSKYEGSLRLACALGFLPLIDGKLAAEDMFTANDYYTTTNLLNVYAVSNITSEDNLETITGEDLITYLSNVVGCNVMGDSSYVSYRKDITRGAGDVDFSKEITREVAAQLIRNTLGINLLENKDNIGFELSEDNIFDKMEVFGITGLVTANNETNLFGGKVTLEGDEIEINSGIVYIKDSKYKSYVGKYVDAFVQTNDNNDIVVLSMTENYEASDSKKTIVPGDITNVTKSLIEYSENNRQNRLKVSKTSSIVKNGVYIGNLDTNTIDFSKCDEVVLYDVNDDNIFDWIIVSKFDYYLVDSVQDRTIQADNYSVTLDFADKEFVNVYIDGKLSSLNQIKPNNVIAVLDDNEDEGCVTICVGTEMADGKVACFSRDEEIKLEDDDAVYKINKNQTVNVLSGEDYRLYLDHNGLVAFVKRNNTAGGYTLTGRKYAYLRKATTDEEFDEIGHFRMWLIEGAEDSKWVTMTSKNKIILEDCSAVPKSKITGKTGTRIRKQAGEIASLPQLSEPQLISYETDIDGNLSKIAIAQDISNDSLDYIDESLFQKSYKWNGGRMYWQGMINKDLAWDESSMMISVPIDRDKEEDYVFVNSAFGDRSYYPAGGIEFYDVLEERVHGGIAIKYEDSSTEISNLSLDSAIKTIVSKVVKYWDEVSQAERIKIVTAEDKEYWTDEPYAVLGLDSCVADPSYVAVAPKVKTVSEIKPGDFIRLKVSSKNKIMAFAVDIRTDILLSECNDGFFYRTQDSGGIVGAGTPETNVFATGWRYGKVVKNGESQFTILVDTEPGDECSIMYCVDRSWGMFEYHTKSHEVNKISRSDIKPGDKFVSYNGIWYIESYMNVVIRED